MTNQTVWVCIATHRRSYAFAPICVVAFEAQEAEEQLPNAVHEQCKRLRHDPDDWQLHDPVERPVLPVSIPSGRARKRAFKAKVDAVMAFQDKLNAKGKRK